MSDRPERSLFELQEDAKRRVMEMRNRSRFAADQMNRALGNPPAASAPPPPLEKAASAGAPENREELEKMFLLALCLLLSHEEADQSVIMGLMYLLT